MDSALSFHTHKMKVVSSITSAPENGFEAREQFRAPSRELDLYQGPRLPRSIFSSFPTLRLIPVSLVLSFIFHELGILVHFWGTLSFFVYTHRECHFLGPGEPARTWVCKSGVRPPGPMPLILKQQISCYLYCSLHHHQLPDFVT